MVFKLRFLQLISQWCLEMDYLNYQNRKIVVLAATNLPNLLDSAILRSGNIRLFDY